LRRISASIDKIGKRKRKIRRKRRWKFEKESGDENSEFKGKRNEEIKKKKKKMEI
jgi:hypothetical protein